MRDRRRAASRGAMTRAPGVGHPTTGVDEHQPPIRQVHRDRVALSDVQHRDAKLIAWPLAIPDAPLRAGEPDQADRDREKAGASRKP